MPPRPKGKEKPSSSATPAAPSLRFQPNANATIVSDPAMLAAPAHPSANAGSPFFDASRPTLPPLSQLQTQPASHLSPSPYSTQLGSYGQTSPHGAPAIYPPSGHQQTKIRLSTDPRSYSTIPLRPGAAEHHLASNLHPETEYSLASAGRSYNPLKRSHESTELSAERHLAYGPGTRASQTDIGDLRMAASRSVSATSTPTTASYPTFGQPTFSSRQSQTSSNPMSSRVSLYIRQQPRAARAGPDGKDRRPIDPPPILQLMMTDFDPDSAPDVEELQNAYYVVHCRLVSANSPRRDVSTLASTTEYGEKEIQRLLLGTLVASPYHTKDDPDPPNMPQHPVSGESSRPPSPSSRFFPVTPAKAKARPPSTMPSTFFIFADISVRKAGEYRLEFNLMRVEAQMLAPGSQMPIIHNVASQVFKVVNAKDFDQVQPSTNLVRGLLDRGAGFPLKLKKGTREGQRRRPEMGSEGERMDSDQGEGDEGSDDDYDE